MQAYTVVSWKIGGEESRRNDPVHSLMATRLRVARPELKKKAAVSQPAVNRDILCLKVGARAVGRGGGREAPFMKTCSQCCLTMVNLMGCGGAVFGMACL